MDHFKDGKSLFVIDKLQKSTDLNYFGVVHIKNMLSREKGNYNFFFLFWYLMQLQLGMEEFLKALLGRVKQILRRDSFSNT